MEPPVAPPTRRPSEAIPAHSPSPLSGVRRSRASLRAAQPRPISFCCPLPAGAPREPATFPPARVFQCLVSALARIEIVLSLGIRSGIEAVDSRVRPAPRFVSLTLGFVVVKTFGCTLSFFTFDPSLSQIGNSGAHGFYFVSQRVFCFYLKCRIIYKEEAS